MVSRTPQDWLIPMITVSSLLAFTSIANAAPDLVVLDLWTVPSSPQQGQTYQIKATVRNQGNTTASAGLFSNQECYFYADNALKGEDNYDDVAAGQTITLSSPNLTAPAAGTHTARVRADANNEVSESNENNNERSETFTVVPEPRPDLTVTDIWTVPSTPQQGQGYQIKASLKNQGNATASAGTFSNQECYFYVDNSLIGEDNYDDVAAGQTITLTSPNLTAPTAGTHTAKVRADANNEVVESNENNNERSETFTVSQPPKPDLIVQSVSGTGSSYDVGQEINATATIKNIGQASAGGTDLKYYLGTSSNHQYRYIEQGSVGSLSPGQSKSDQINFGYTIPTNVPDGTYQIWVQSDSSNDEAESNENNNWGSSPSFTIQTPKADLVVLDILMNATTNLPNVRPGDDVRLDFDVKNIGDATTIANVHIRWYWGTSQNSLSNLIDNGSLGSINGLSPGETERETDASWIIPSGLSPGTYWITAFVDWDDRVDEYDETNNNKRSESFTALEPLRPDLIVTSVTGTTSSYYLSEKINATATIKNNGQASAASTDLKYYLGTSSNPTFRYIEQGTVSSLSPSQSKNDQINPPGWTVPTDVPSGTYRIWVQADSSNGENESNENNNWGSSSPFAIGPEPEVTALTWRQGSSTNSPEISAAEACTNVYARADAAGMDGQSITVEIWEADALGDNYIASVDITIQSGGFGTAIWTAEWECDKVGCLGGCPEYYLKYPGVSNSPNLHVCDTTPPSTPVLQSPPDGSEVLEGDITFSWSPSTEASCGSGVEHYAFYLDNSPIFLDPVTIETPQTAITLPSLSPGTYCWRVRATDALDNWAYSTHSCFNVYADSEPLPQGKWTIIVHGYSLFNSYLDLVTNEGWMRVLAERIESLDPGNVVVHTMDTDSFAIAPQSADVSKHHVLLFDWVDNSTREDRSDSVERGQLLGADGFAYAAGDALYALTKELGISRDIQALIGHSRGSIVVSETARRLIADGEQPNQVIYLDAEPGSAVSIYSDERFDAWQVISGNPVRFDNIYKLGGSNDFLGGHPRPRCYDFDLGGEFDHDNIHSEYLARVLLFDGERFVYDRTATRAPSLPPLNITAPQPEQVGECGNRVQTLNNGCFGWENTGLDHSEIAGWMGHGGGGTGHIRNGRLELDAGSDDHWRRHSWLYLPADVSALVFDYEVTNTTETGNKLAVYIGEENASNRICTLDLDVEHSGNKACAIPLQFRDTVDTITFSIDFGASVTSEVEIDNIKLEECDIPNAPIDGIANPEKLCSSESTTLSAFAAGAIIEWFVDGCGVSLVETGQSIYVTPGETTTYYARARDNTTGCISEECEVVVVEVLDATGCNDEEFCTGIESCSGGQCISPGDPCASSGALCDEVRDLCVECLINTDCDDYIDCTVDTCLDGACNFAPDDSLCVDLWFCNGQESCNEQIGCISSGDPCEGQGLSCDEDLDSCVDCLNNSDCGDSEFCNGVEACEFGTCVSPGDPCAGLSLLCDENTDRCVECIGNADCVDDEFCNGEETCSDGTCVASGDPCSTQALLCDESVDACVECLSDSDCDDEIACTDDVCAEGVCITIGNDGYCPDDGEYCNGQEFCDTALGCVSSGNPCTDLGLACNETSHDCGACTSNTDCDDNVECTDDVCNSGTCGFIENDSNCADDTEFCNGVETCNAQTGCISSGDPCLKQGLYCDEVADVCNECLNNTHCSDSEFCNGAENCIGGVCTAGAIPCVDGQICNEVVDACLPIGQDCNSNGIGDAADIESGTSGDTNANGIPDECDECTVDDDCDDGIFCNGMEICNVDACESGVDSCLPGEICDELGEMCLQPDCNSNGIGDLDDIAGGTSSDDNRNGIPDECDGCTTNADCDDGVFCNGLEVCDAGVCASLGGPCSPGQTCNELAGECTSSGSGGGGGGGGGGEPHPADKLHSWEGDCSCATCGDNRIELCEAIGYMAAFLQGEHDDEDGANQAIQIWLDGETYTWDTTEQDWFASEYGP